MSLNESRPWELPFEPPQRRPAFEPTDESRSLPVQLRLEMGLLVVVPRLKACAAARALVDTGLVDDGASPKRSPSRLEGRSSWSCGRPSASSAR